MFKEEIDKKIQVINTLLVLCDYKAALELCENVLVESESNQYVKGKIEIFKILALVYFNKADYSKSFEYAVMVSKLLEELDEVDQLLDNDITFARFFIRHKDYNDALNLLKSGLKIAIKENNHSQEVIISNMMGYTFCELRQYDVAQELLESALDIAQKNNHVKYIPEIKMNLTKIYIAVGAYDQARKLLDDAFIVVENLKDYAKIIHANLLYANISYQVNDFEGTQQFAEKAKHTAKEYGFNYELADAYEWLHLASSSQQKYEEAYDFLLKYVETSQKIVNVEKEKSLSRMRIKYDLYQKEKEAQILRNKNDKIRKQREELEHLMVVLGRQNEELHSIAIKDYLTGTYNRKYFMMKFEEEFSIADEHGRDLSCLVFDIDKFKAVNDTYGHLIGDEVIKNIVDRCTMSMGTQGIIGRFGGDEFVLLLIGSNIFQAEEIGQNILKNICNSYVVYGDVKIYATISIGIADNKMGHSCNAEDMIRIADSALYKAKENGRNQLSIAYDEKSSNEAKKESD